jgi:hypothetical protein
VSHTINLTQKGSREPFLRFRFAADFFEQADDFKLIVGNILSFIFKSS